MDQGKDSRASPEPGSLADELRRARAEQAAVAKLLRIVSHTRDDPRAALDAIARCRRELFDGMTMSIRLVEGDSYKEAATNLGITVNTINAHVTEILRKAGVKSSRRLASVLLRDVAGRGSADA